MYPPVLLVLCGWLAALPQAAACALFEALGYIPLAWCLWRLLPRHRGALPLLAAPAFLMNAGSGQTGFFSAAAFAAAALLIARAPALAGACLGLLVYKPHLALLVPILLLAAGQWRALFACAATAAALSAATLLALPVATWTGFLAQAHLARHVLEYSSTAALVISPFGALHAAGAGLAASYAVQALCALACLALAITAARRNPGAGGIALLAAASLVATPYAMDYDLAVAMVPAVWLIAEAQRHGWRAWEKLTLATLYVLPLFARATVILTGFQPAPLVLAALLVLVWRRAITQPQPCAPGAAGIGSAGTDAHGPSRRLTHTVPKQRSTV